MRNRDPHLPHEAVHQDIGVPYLKAAKVFLGSIHTPPPNAPYIYFRVEPLLKDTPEMRTPP